ncbi:MAG: hypothetical protein KFH87_09545 [Bacteroidetes bacterium]|nr:hypothetical protein [Bacteroidota bacterium]
MSYRFNRAQIRFLSSDQAADIHREYREQAEKYADSLRIQTALRAQYSDLPSDIIAACMAQFALQWRGAAKCNLPDNALYTEAALEMASSAATAALHAALLGNVFPHPPRILEIAAGIGSDSVALARNAGTLVCIEADPVHTLMLRHNLAAAHAPNTCVLRGKAEDVLPALRLEGIDAVFADPARRNAGRRYVNVEQYAPPLSIFDAFSPDLPLLVKIGPAATAPEGWQVATVAADGECKEILLHRNLGLPAICALDAESGERWTAPTSPPLPVSVGNPVWLIEAHGAIIRTGQLASYFREQHCEAIDPHIAYAWSETRPEDSRWHQCFHILRIEPYNRKGLQRGIDALDFGPGSEIKKRGFPETTDSIRARLHFRGRRNGVVILTRQADAHLMIFAKRP